MIDWIVNGGWILMCSVCGMVMVFQEMLPKPRPAKPAKRKPKPKAKRAKITRPKAKKEKKKEWAKMPDYTPVQIANIERMFRVGRGETDLAW